MDTQTLNNTPNNCGEDDKSEKATMLKKAAGETAKFAGAAGLGIAATMGAHAMNNSEDPIEETQDEPQSHATHEESVEEVIETTTDFNPNDIMIEVVEEIVTEETHQPQSAAIADDKQDLVAVEELQPITGENIDVVIGDDGTDIAVIDIDDPSVVDVIVDSEPMIGAEEILSDPDWLAINGETGELLASEDLSAPDVLSDILA